MMNRLFISTCLVFFTVAPSIATAGDNGLGVKASTLGAGIEYERLFSDNLGMRLGFNYFQFDGDFTVDDINYDSSNNMQTASAILDWYPLAGAFRLTGGIMYNGNESDVTATPDVAVSVGDIVYTPQMIGTLQGSVTFNTFSPYAGIGWSSGREKREGLSVALDVGVLFQGAPTVEDYHATGLIAIIPGIQTELDKEAAKIEDELEPYQYYPVVALTLTYRF